MMLGNETIMDVSRGQNEPSPQIIVAGLPQTEKLEFNGIFPAFPFQSVARSGRVVLTQTVEAVMAFRLQGLFWTQVIFKESRE